MEKLRRADHIKTNIYAWLLLLPSLIFLVLFTFYPVLLTAYDSFFHKNLGIQEPIFAGMDNYKAVMEDEVFWKALFNNLWFAAGTVPISIAIAIAMALFVNKAISGKGWIRTIFFYPAVIPVIAIANIWLFMYSPGYGLFNRFLDFFGLPGISWLGDPSVVMWSMIIMMIWKEAGFFMIFYLAGLQNISKELYESASLDGSSAWTTFWKITFPLLMPTTLFVFIIAVTNTFKTVDHIFIMTQGGPNNASNLLLYYIWENAFTYWDHGMASTITLIMLILMIIITCLQFFSLDKKIHYS